MCDVTMMCECVSEYTFCPCTAVDVYPLRSVLTGVMRVCVDVNVGAPVSLFVYVVSCWYLSLTNKTAPIPTSNRFIILLSTDNNNP